MPEPSDLDRLAVRRQFDRRSESPGPADFLFREVERRMIERSSGWENAVVPGLTSQSLIHGASRRMA
jgi:hypothetical protein